MKIVTPPQDALLFIDAYNLLHQFDDFVDLLHEDPCAARQLFYREFVNLPQLKLDHVRLVVDGARLPDEIVPPGLPVIWAASPDCADARILKLLLREARRQGRHRRFLVVTDDRDLAMRARQKGAEILPCSSFIQLFRFGQPHPSPSGSQASSSTAPNPGRIRKSGGQMNDGDVQWWLSQMQDKKGEEDALEEGMISYSRKKPKAASQAEQDISSSRESVESSPEEETFDEEWTSYSRDAKKNTPSEKKKKNPRRDDLSEADQAYARMLGLDPDDPDIQVEGDDDECWDGSDPYSKKGT